MRSIVIAGLVAAATAFPLAQLATETLVVTASNTRGWTTADTRPGGAVALVLDATAPGGTGALQLTTNNTTAAKAQYLHETSTPLADVTDLSYYVKQNSALFEQGQASFQLLVNLCGPDAGFTTFVFEPYQNVNMVPVAAAGTWQQWDVDADQFWSSRSVTCGSSSVQAGFGGPPFYTLAALKAAFPDAVAVGFGVNIGTFNADWDVQADLVQFNETIYDFEVYSTPATADDCKKGGWSTFNPPSGPFKNQGQCVSSVVRR